MIEAWADAFSNLWDPLPFLLGFITIAAAGFLRGDDSLLIRQRAVARIPVTVSPAPTPPPRLRPTGTMSPRERAIARHHGIPNDARTLALVITCQSLLRGYLIRRRHHEHNEGKEIKLSTIREAEVMTPV